MKKLTPLYLLMACFLALLNSCDEPILKQGQTIKMNDPSMIVTENDSAYLTNIVNDISKTEQDAKEIARIVVQVDSVKVAEELEEFTATDANISGFTVAFSNCKVIFENLGAKELTAQNPETSRSVSYLVTQGDLAKMKIKIIGLQEAAIKERIYTKLKVAQGDEEYLLKSLGRKISDWFPLAGNKDIFVAAGDNSFQFNNLTHTKIKLALDKELRAKNTSEAKIQEWMRLIKNTADYTDAPCRLYVATAQFRITGKTAKGTVNKLIQFDIVE